MKKINWGTGIVITFVLFIGFILYFVIKASTATTYEYDLVAEDYYKDELEYQAKIDKLENAKTLSSNIAITRTESGVTIEFPSHFDSEKIKGTLFLYRPSDRILDRSIPIVLNNFTQEVSKSILIAGRWDIHVDWSYEGTSYLYIQKFNF